MSANPPPPSSTDSVEKPHALEIPTTASSPPPGAHYGPFSPGRNVAFHPPSRKPTRESLDLDDYFEGPRDMQRHSKLPLFMRIHGSVLPKMLLPLAFVAGWATCITCISHFVYSLAVDTLLLTVLGFVVAFGLSFRVSTAYERYNDGRKYWSQLTLASRNLARALWVHTAERHEKSADLGKSDLLGKLTALNLINAFAVALKHRLRFEPAADYPDLASLISHLQGTMAVNADQEQLRHKKPTPWKKTGESLGVTFAQSNPRKLIKRSKDNLGNLPLEILTYLSAYMDMVFSNDTFTRPCHQSNAMIDIRLLADVLAGCERVLNTPLPLAYSISISQITWAYIMILPFQLVAKLGWVTIPGTIVAAYIILGLAIIGREIENPFGNDVNDLPLDDYCREIAADIDVLTSAPVPSPLDFIRDPNNRVLFPLSNTSVESWEQRSVDDIRDALKAKATTSAKSVQLQRVKTELRTDQMTETV